MIFLILFFYFSGTTPIKKIRIKSAVHKKALGAENVIDQPDCVCVFILEAFQNTKGSGSDLVFDEGTVFSTWKGLMNGFCLKNIAASSTTPVTQD